jgi:hypothetical protein
MLYTKKTEYSKAHNVSRQHVYNLIENWEVLEILDQKWKKYLINQKELLKFLLENI